MRLIYIIFFLIAISLCSVLVSGNVLNKNLISLNWNTNYNPPKLEIKCLPGAISSSVPYIYVIYGNHFSRVAVLPDGRCLTTILPSAKPGQMVQILLIPPLKRSISGVPFSGALSLYSNFLNYGSNAASTFLNSPFNSLSFFAPSFFSGLI